MLFDLMGRNLINQAHVNTLDFQHLPAGVYLLKWKLGAEFGQIKVIKQ
jgi:hypothetical protein